MNKVTKYLLIFMAIGLPFGATAQFSPTDSLQVKALFAQADSLRFIDAYRALSAWDVAADYCAQIGWQERYVAACSGAAFQSTAFDKANITFEYIQKFKKAFLANKNSLGKHYNAHELDLIQANCFYFILVGDHKQSVNYAKQHLSRLKSDTSSKKYSIFNDYFNIAAEELAMGNIQNAIENYSEAYKIQKKYYPKDHRRNLQTNLSLGELYTRIANYTQASFYYKNALIAKDSLLKSKTKQENTQQDYIVLYHSIADFYKKRQLYDSSRFYLEASLKYHNASHPFWDLTMQKLGDICIELKDYNKAAYYLQKALVAAKIKYTRNYNLARLYLSFARLYERKGQFDTALSYTQQALIALSERFDKTDIRSTPSVSEVFSKRDLLAALEMKADLLLKASDKRADYLPIAYTTVRDAETLIDAIRSDCTSDFDKQYLSDLCYPIYEKSVRIAYRLYEREHKEDYLLSVFNSIEKSKASVLLDALKGAQAETQLGENDRNRLYQLRSEYAKLEENIYREKYQNNKIIGDPSVQAYQDRLVAVKNQFNDFIKTLETKYPEYYRLKFGKLTRDIQEIQASLAANDMLLDYFMTTDAVYIVALTATNKQVLKKDKTPAFDKNIAALRRCISIKENIPPSVYASKANAIYALLLQDVLLKSHANQAIKRLIIIPDGTLNYIPFEILTTQPFAGSEDFRSLRYLVKDYLVGYAYSATSLFEQKNMKKNRAAKTLGGFAPSYDIKQKNDSLAYRSPVLTLRGDNLRNLPGALKEVNFATTLFRGTPFIAEKATEGIFKQRAKDFRILHLGMHSLLDDNYPLLSHLVFAQNNSDTLNDNSLTINELYGMGLNADLAVLSACNTGMGELNRGEGVISLSRAFAYAGVPSTVMSLWEVEDGATSDIIQYFYENLKAGQSKDEALRNAKVRYLKECKSTTEAHPFFWTGLIAIGNLDAMDISTPLSISPLLGGSLAILVLIPLFFIIKKRFKNRS